MYNESVNVIDRCNIAFDNNDGIGGISHKRCYNVKTVLQ